MTKWSVYSTRDPFNLWTRECSWRDPAAWLLFILNLPRSAWVAEQNDSGGYRVHAIGESHTEWIAYPA